MKYYYFIIVSPIAPYLLLRIFFAAPPLHLNPYALHALLSLCCRYLPSWREKTRRRRDSATGVPYYKEYNPTSVLRADKNDGDSGSSMCTSNDPEGLSIDCGGGAVGDLSCVAVDGHPAVGDGDAEGPRLSAAVTACLLPRRFPGFKYHECIIT